jgi:protein-S-isoprenylcysteine O-methyltransferase Ste14
MAPTGLVRTVLGRLFGAALFLSAMLFLPAGTLRYWEAWVYLSMLFTTAATLIVHLLRTDPELLERRMRTREKEPEQRRFIALSAVCFFLMFLLPGLDHRYGWSSVPVPLVIVADALVLLGYGMFAWVLAENRYASRVIEVEPGQKVVSTGPYAHVRHPMYAAALMMYVATPLALGSFWAMVPALFLPLLMAMRIRNEEQVLSRALEGYPEYMKRVRYRLMPGVW